MATTLDEQGVEELAVGAAVMGTGGGGDPYLGKLMVLKAIREHGPITLLDPTELPDDCLVIPTAMMGAPTVIIEKLPQGGESVRCLRRLERHLGRRAYATMPIESGGVNSTIPLVTAARAGIPVVDADGMGRAFPELQMETFHIYGISGSPLAIYNERGDCCLVETLDNYMLEHLARAITVRMGAAAYIAEYPMSGKQVKETAIPGTLSLAIKIGRAILGAREKKLDPVEEIQRATEDSTYGRAHVLFKGKIVDVARQTTGGFARGSVRVEGFDEFQGQKLEVDFQNENLVARVDGEVVASVPDLITLLDLETGQPITTERLRYGFRVVAIGIPTPPLMRTPEALAVWGPRYFGYDIDFVPIERRLARAARGERV